MNNTIPPEIKKWIKGYADAHDFLRSDINEIIVKALTSLYQHLQENGRVAELEKEVERLKKIIEIKEQERKEWAGMYIKKKQECDELKEEIKNL